MVWFNDSIILVISISFSNEIESNINNSLTVWVSRDGEDRLRQLQLKQFMENSTNGGNELNLEKYLSCNYNENNG